MSALTISPEDEKRVKGMGFLNNRGTDLFSARVLTTNGKVTAAQHRCMADAAEKFGNGELLYTTRLSVEIPGIPYDKIEEFQKFIAKEGLVTGGTGAKVRPVVSCKGTTCQYGLLDSYAVSEEIYRRFYEGYREVALPHKFKIAVGGCPKELLDREFQTSMQMYVKAARNVPLRLPVQTKWQRWLMGRFRLTKTYVKTAAAVLENVRFIPLRTALTAIRYT